MLHPHMAIRVFLVASPLPMSTAVRAWLGDRPDIALVGTADQPGPAAEAAGRLSPDVILLDAGGRPTAGLELVARLIGLPGPPRILVLGPSPQGETARPWRIAGAAGCLSEHCTKEDLLAAIRLVAAGGLAFDPALPGPLPPAGGAPGTRHPRPLLSQAALEDFLPTRGRAGSQGNRRASRAEPAHVGRASRQHPPQAGAAGRARTDAPRDALGGTRAGAGADQPLLPGTPPPAPGGG